VRYSNLDETGTSWTLLSGRGLEFDDEFGRYAEPGDRDRVAPPDGVGQILIAAQGFY
jgi:hypothetical protein